MALQQPSQNSMKKALHTQDPAPKGMRVKLSAESAREAGSFTLGNEMT